MATAAGIKKGASSSIQQQANLLRSLTFLGTSSGVPTPFRNVSGMCLSFTDGRVWLLDCGEGTQHQLLKATNVSSGKIDRIFITHLHGDHCYGLPGLMCSVSMMWQAPGVRAPPPEFEAARKANGGGKEEKDEEGEVAEDYDGPWHHDWFSKESEYLELVGPQGLGHYIRTVLRQSEAGFGFKYRVTELMAPKPTSCEGEDNKSCSKMQSSGGGGKPSVVVAGREELAEEELYLHEGTPQCLYPNAAGNYDVIPEGSAASIAAGGISVKGAQLDHRVFCCGYAITEATSPGTLDMKKVAGLGVPKGPLLGKLKNGEAITFTQKKDKTASPEKKDTGKEDDEISITVSPEQCVGAPTPGRTVLLLGDTCDSSKCLAIASGCEWMTHEATFDDANQHLALPRGHSTARMAGKFAKEIQAKNLILTHFSARFPPVSKDPGPIETLIREAQEECAKPTENTKAGSSEADTTTSSTTAGGATVVAPSAYQSTVVHAAEDFKVFDLSRSKKKSDL